jgi:hypothetical protein
MMRINALPNPSPSMTIGARFDWQDRELMSTGQPDVSAGNDFDEGTASR